MSRPIPRIAVHGGAGRTPPDESAPAYAAQAEHGLRAALGAGAECLRGGGSALDAVVAAVRELEDCPVFNAGRGGVLDAAGAIALDAAVMEGAGGRAGGVLGVRRIAHPVEAARAVLREGRHVLLAGQGAELFAREAGLPWVDLDYHVTEAARLQLARVRSDPPPGGGTVGAVALDAAGHLAAATSTGGMVARRPGRVADSALPGSGTWADDATCAVSATGHGEYFIRTAFARAVDARVRWAGRDLDGACREALADVAALGGRGGCIALDARGVFALCFDTPDMPRGVCIGDQAPRVVVRGRETLTD